MEKKFFLKMRREKKFRVLYPTQINFPRLSPSGFLENIFLFEGKKQREVFFNYSSSQFRTQNIYTHKRPSVSSPEKMEQQLLLAGRRHASFLCSSSSLSLSKKLKKNIRGGGGGALFSRDLFF